MQNYKESVAYDFELFTPKEKKKEQANIVALPEKNKAHSTKAKTKALPARRMVSSVLVATLALMMIFLRVYGEVENAEVKEDIQSAQSAIEQLKSEETRLKMELETKVTFANVEKKAAEMGMQKRDDAQTNYVTLEGEDSAEIIEENGTASFFSKLANLF